MLKNHSSNFHQNSTVSGTMHNPTSSYQTIDSVQTGVKLGGEIPVMRAERKAAQKKAMTKPKAFKAPGQSARNNSLSPTVEEKSTPLSISNSTKLPARGRPKKHVPSSVPPSPQWNCPTCQRSMQEAQKQDHLMGKKHSARLKVTETSQHQALKSKTTPTTGPESVSKDSSAHNAANVSTSNPRENVKNESFKTKKYRSHGKEPAHKGSSEQQPAKAIKYRQRHGAGLPKPHLSGYGFMGFSRSQNISGYTFSEGGEYGLCDKDCGWCGHCMDGMML